MMEHTYFENFFTRLEAGKRILSYDCRHHLESIAQVEYFQRMEHLQRKGKEVRYVWFLLDGCLRSRNFYDKKPDDVTSWLWFPGQWAGVFSHLFSCSPSDRIIEAIVDSVVLQFSFSDLITTRALFPNDWQIIATDMIEGHIRNCDQRHEQMVTLSARERYLKLLNAHPEVFQMINQREIASYLNISREELSRLRALR